MRNSQRRFLAQNFLYDRSLVSKLVRLTSIGKKDTVLEIGSGKGIITKELLTHAKNVISLEVDFHLYKNLKRDFMSEERLFLRNVDFKDYVLPNYPYKVFSNIPFNITAEVILKLTQSTNPPDEAYLIIQKEAAKRFLGKPYDVKDSQISIILKPYFELSVIYNLNRRNFYPTPSVDSVLIKIKKREHPLLDYRYKKEFENFIIYIFNQTNPTIEKSLRGILGGNIKINLHLKPSQLSISDWLVLFSTYQLQAKSDAKQKVLNFAMKIKLNQKNLKKIHRTRNDSNWRKYQK